MPQSFAFWREVLVPEIKSGIFRRDEDSILGVVFSVSLLTLGSVVVASGICGQIGDGQRFDFPPLASTLFR